MHDYSFIAFATWLFLCPYAPAILVAIQPGEKVPFASFLILEISVCLFVALVCFYLGELAPSQGIVATPIFSEKNLGAIEAWTAVQWSLRFVGFALGIFFAWNAFQHKVTRRWIIEATVAVTCTIIGALTPYVMSQLAGTIRDAFLLSK